ncbi:hypothetical protein [Rubellimicrobium roseum]|uniref:Uracil-DNA glycosylase-like domain-containing protein n=1 Tax=Rubellimicrobium roseum TaxID=687525 RepID=A0A5C4NHN0_9RHOB|nr:hypothetical protein [Rubellimicrobium roseum]TNC74334.1 hypothetical protein FHG71_03910 [Rubellimicrobium roseum]
MHHRLVTLSEGSLTAATLRRTPELEIYPAPGEADCEGISVVWAPFDAVNPHAKLAIVGVTPGPNQAERALLAARRAALAGHDPTHEITQIKCESSFRGKQGTNDRAIEENLKALLEHSGVAERVGIDDVDELWKAEAHKVHFTSTLRYPTFIGDKLFNNQIDSLKHPFLRLMIEDLLAAELRQLPSDAIIAVLGRRGPGVVRHAARLAGLDLTRIVALQHPSPNNHDGVRQYLAKERTQSKRPCRCFLCDPSRLLPNWDVTRWIGMHRSTHE